MNDETDLFGVSIGKTRPAVVPDAHAGRVNHEELSPFANQEPDAVTTGRNRPYTFRKISPTVTVIFHESYPD